MTRGLPWSAFLEVLPVEDALAREFYITMAANERWSVRQLRNQMDAMLYERTLISRKPEDVIKTELPDKDILRAQLQKEIAQAKLRLENQKED